MQVWQGDKKTAAIEEERLRVEYSAINAFFSYLPWYIFVKLSIQDSKFLYLTTSLTDMLTNRWIAFYA